MCALATFHTNLCILLFYTENAYFMLNKDDIYSETFVLFSHLYISNDLVLVRYSLSENKVYTNLL